MRKKETIDSFIGKDATFEGKLSFKGTVRIDGNFRGEIAASGNLVIGTEGKIDADIHASSVVSSGDIRGKVTAEKLIDLKAPGKMCGDIQAPTVVIQEGVVFEGNCRTAQKTASGDKHSGKIHQIFL